MRFKRSLIAVAVSGSMLGCFGVSMAGSAAHATACPDHSPNNPDPTATKAPYSTPLAGGWTLYASGNPTSGAPSGTSGYVGLDGQNEPGVGTGYIEVGGDATNPQGSGYALIGGYDDQVGVYQGHTVTGSGC